MRRLLSFLLIIFVPAIVFGQSKNAVKMQVLGYSYNFGTEESGGKTFDFNVGVLKPGDKLFFEVISGTCDVISVEAVNKYNVNSTVFDDGKPDEYYLYDSYFDKFTEEVGFRTFKVFVNGNHENFNQQACVVRVSIVTKAELINNDYKFVLEPKVPVSEDSYTGVAIDGISRLRIDFYYPGNKELKIEIPQFGIFKNDVGNVIRAGSNSLKLDEAGHTYIVFCPPTQVSQKKWNELCAESTPPTGQEIYSGNISAFSVDLRIPLSYNLTTDSVVNDTSIIQLYRAPVLFVQGYLGAEKLWKGFNIDLAKSGFFTVSKNYFAGEGSLEDQSDILSENIVTELASLNSRGMKVAKFDLVCHSIGGLIARNYVISKTYGHNVRKLITVGTPNHGMGNVDFFAGTSDYFKEKHKIAIAELRENSAFLQKLNSGECSGSHLIEGIEYGNIYTNPSDYCVYASSARINMVASMELYEVPHTSDLGQKALTNHPSVENQIVEWLGMRINIAPNICLQGFLSTQSQGEIYISYFPIIGSELMEEKLTSFPYEIKSYNSIRTGKGTAVLHFKSEDKVWASVFMDENTEIHIGSYNPECMEIRLIKGNAQFKSVEARGGHFIVNVQDKNLKYNENGSFSFSQVATIIGLDTEFAVEYNENLKIIGIEGKMEVYTDRNPYAQPFLLNGKESISILGNLILSAGYPNIDWCVDLTEIIANEEKVVPVDPPDASDTAGAAFVHGGLVVVGIVMLVLFIFILMTIIALRRRRKG